MVRPKMRVFFLANQNQSVPDYFPAVDVVRFLAALSVALFHLTYRVWLPDFADGAGEIYRRAFECISRATQYGSLGVAWFFVVSGFVIGFSASRNSASSFVLGRVRRLYPAAWICSIITGAGFLLDDRDIIGKLARSVLLWPNGPWVDGSYWTLPVEMGFYLLVAGALAIAPRAAVPCVGGVLGAASALFWLTRSLDFTAGGHLRHVFSILEITPVVGSILNSGCFFALGITLWAIQTAGFSITKSVLAILCTITGGIALAAATRFQVSVGGSTASVLYVTLIWIIGAAAIAWCALANKGISEIPRPIAQSIRAIGLAAYPLYLLHEQAGFQIMRALEGVAPPFLSLILTLTMILAASFAVVRGERVVRAWMYVGNQKRFTNEKPAAASG